MFADLKMLEPALKMNQNSSSWRTSSEYYRPVINGLKPGSMNISPAWFEQGHEVLLLFTSCSTSFYRSDWAVGGTSPESIGRTQEREPYLRVVKEEPMAIRIDWRDPEHYSTFVI